MKLGLAVFRALMCFFAFIPFCFLWGIDNFTWFGLVSTVYFIPVHYVLDKLIGVLN